MKEWYKRLYSRNLQLPDTKWGAWVLFFFAFADASLVPMPVTTCFLVLTLLNTRNTFKYVFLVTFGMLTGAIAGYSIGHFAWLDQEGKFTGFSQFLFDNIPGFSIGIYDKVHSLFVKWDLWILVIAASTPVPYSVLSVTSGVFNINLIIFCITTLLTQGIKFFILGFLTIKLGAKVKTLIEFNWKPVAIILTLFILVVFAVIKIF
jgi:membrane protein YqaA with SNARE-associated domain